MSTPQQKPCCLEMPELFQRHFDELVKGSGISVDVIRERGYKTILGVAELQKLGFAKYQRKTPGLYLPVWTTEGKNTLCQYKPDTPRQNHKGKDVKYETPGDAALRIDVAPRCREDLKNPNIRLWITEGIKKADALASRSECVIDVLGVWGFKHKNEFKAPTISVDLDYIAFKDRTVFICFDSDVMTKRQVRQALDEITEVLKRKGATVCHVYLPSPDGKKVGVDDYLLNHSIDELLSHAVRPDDISMIKEETGNIYSFDSMGYLCRSKFTKEGMIKVRLCNFDARVIEVVMQDNGTDLPTQHYKIEARTTIKHLGTITILSSSFDAMNWTHNLDYAANLEPGAGSKDYVRDYIKKQSSPERITTYTHTGFRQINDEWFFLTAGGAIGGDKINVRLESELERYSLPLIPENESRSILTSLSFLELADKKITLPLFSLVYLSPLTTLLSPMPNFSGYLWGPSQVFKTTLALLLLSHFGNFDDAKLLSNFEDTANSLMRRAFTLKDMLFVVDDYHPSTQRTASLLKETVAQRLIRSFSNRTERGRLFADMSERPRYEPRGMLLITGEDLVSVLSTLARVQVIEIADGEVDRGKLRELQTKAHLLPNAMTSYILWVREHLDEIVKEFRGTFLQLRDKAWKDGFYGKAPEQCAFLQFTLDTILSWMTDKEVISDARAKEIAEEGWITFAAIAKRQGQILIDEDPVNKFKEILNTLITQGKVKIWGKGSLAILGSSDGEFLGFYDDLFFYLLPEAMWNIIQKTCISAGEHFPVSKRTLYKMLRNRNLIEFKGDANIVNATIDNESYRVLKVYREKMTLNDVKNDVEMT